jgi:protein-S-isoprenylcysteine O-methyltransferase Ste14
MLHIGSIWIPLLVLLPNLVYSFYTRRNLRRSSSAQESPPALRGKGEPPLLLALERLGQAGVFIFPLLFRPHYRGAAALLALALMAICLLLYYAGWLRYFFRGRRERDLWRPLWGLPLPLAVTPICYFLGTSLLLRSWVVLAAVVVLAAGHIPLSARSRRHLFTAGEP